MGHLEIQIIDGITVIRFVDSQIMDESKVEQISDALMETARSLSNTKIVLDFTCVKFMCSSMFGRLVTFSKMLNSQGTEWILSGVSPEIVEYFKRSRLSTIFHVVDSVDDATIAFKELICKFNCPFRNCASDVFVRYSKASASNLYTRIQECTGCGVILRFQGRLPVDAYEESLRIREITLPTYDDESIAIDLGRWTSLPVVTVHGRLDLFAFDAFEEAWGTLSRFPRILFDLSQAAEFSDLGLKSLFELLSRDEPRTKAAILVVESSLDYVQSLAGPTSIYTNREAATLELADGPKADPLTVVVRPATLG